METGNYCKNTKIAVVFTSFILLLLVIIIYWSKAAIRKAANMEFGTEIEESNENSAKIGTVHLQNTERRFRRSPALTFPITTLYTGGESASVYMVDYSYDQVDRTIYPTIFGAIVVYKRRYGYRHGPYYGYGAYEDAPPFYGYGDVKNGFGIDPLADIRAAIALHDGRIISSQILPMYMQAAKT